MEAGIKEDKHVFFLHHIKVRSLPFCTFLNDSLNDCTILRLCLRKRLHLLQFCLGTAQLNCIGERFGHKINRHEKDFNKSMPSNGFWSKS